MNVAHNVNLSAVPDSAVSVFVPMPSKIVINAVVISENHALGEHLFLDDAHDGIFLHVLSDKGANAATALYQSDNGSLGVKQAIRRAATIPATLAAEVAFVNLY